MASVRVFRPSHRVAAGRARPNGARPMIGPTMATIGRPRVDAAKKRAVVKPDRGVSRTPVGGRWPVVRQRESTPGKDVRRSASGYIWSPVGAD